MSVIQPAARDHVLVYGPAVNVDYFDVCDHLKALWISMPCAAS